MGLEQQLTDTLTRAMKDKDAPTANVVRMLKTKLQERRTAKGFSGTVDDALVVDVIGAYRKQLQKALAEFEKVGERGAEQAAQLRFEIEFCERYLPKTMDEAGVRALVKERGVSVLFTTHDLGTAHELCDRVVVISHGRAVAEGTVEELLARTGQQDFEACFVQLAFGAAVEGAGA